MVSHLGFSEKKPVVWYLAHPLAPDERFTFAQNMSHVLHMMRLCLDAGILVVAPYYTHCTILEDSPTNRTLGLSIDCEVVSRLGRILLVGHKVSTGMQQEWQACNKVGGVSWNLTSLKDEIVREMISKHRETMEL